MAIFNYYDGWNVDELLAERRSVQNQLSTGRTTLVKLSNETVETNDRTAVPLETILERIGYALFLLDPDTYANPYGTQGVTLQNYG